MSEEKIGMYSTKEIYEELANGFLHHSMVDAMYFKIKDLQQKVEQLEKENEQLRTQVNTYENPDDLTLFYMWLDEKAKDKIKQLENIRKEAIELLKKCGIVDEKGNFNAYLDTIELKELLNILNKGDNNGK